MARGLTSPLNLSLADNVLVVGKFSSRGTKFGSGSPPFWGNLGAKLTFLNLLTFFN